MGVTHQRERERHRIKLQVNGQCNLPKLFAPRHGRVKFFTCEKTQLFRLCLLASFFFFYSFFSLYISCAVSRREREREKYSTTLWCSREGGHFELRRVKSEVQRRISPIRQRFNPPWAKWRQKQAAPFSSLTLSL